MGVKQRKKAQPSRRTNVCTNARRYRRIAEGLFRYLPTKQIYGTFSHQGRRVWRNLKTDDKEKARAEFAKWTAEVVAAPPKSPDPKRAVLKTHTFGELLDAYDKTLDGYAEGTRIVRRYLLGVLRRTWGEGMDLPVQAVTVGLLRTWLASRGLRRVGQQNYARVIRSMFTLAVDLDWIDKSPAEALRVGRAEQPTRLTPDWKTALRLVNSVRRQESREFLQFMLLAGLGQAEVRELSGDCFDFAQQLIHVRRKKTQRAYTIPIFPHLKPLLGRLKKEGRLGPEADTVFTMISPHEALRGVCAKLGLPHYSPRSLRRAFVVHCLEKGVDPRLVAAWQGHSDNGALLLKTYGRYINQDHVRRMARLLS